MWKIVAALVATIVATIVVMQVSAAENEVVDYENLQQQARRFEQQLTSQNQQLMQQMDNMQQQVSRFEQQLTSQNQQLIQQMENMQQQWAAEKKQLKDEINKLTHHIGELEEGNNQFQNKTENLFGKVTHDNQNLRHLVENSSTQHKHNSLVAFSAYASEIRNYDEGDIVQFDTVITNEGGFYSGQSSTFLCVYTGYYLFSVNLGSSNGKYMYADIEVGGDTVASVWAHSDYDSASTTVIASCPQGTEVNVRCTGNGHTMLGHQSALVSMFTGILLYSA